MRKKKKGGRWQEEANMLARRISCSCSCHRHRSCSHHCHSCYCHRHRCYSHHPCCCCHPAHLRRPFVSVPNRVYRCCCSHRSHLLAWDHDRLSSPAKCTTLIVTSLPLLAWVYRGSAFRTPHPYPRKPYPQQVQVHTTLRILRCHTKPVVPLAPGGSYFHHTLPKTSRS